MKVNPIAAAEGSARAQGNAHGLLRQLQEGTFRGASIEKHRARFADRLAAAHEDAVESSTDAATTDPTKADTAPRQIASTPDGLAPRIGQYVDYVV
ncbi:MAG TPA: hypothetical protein VF190_02170 [Rhodothermales bacterium]